MMTGNVLVRAKAALILLTALAAPAQAVNWSSKTIAYYFLDTRACTFFVLSGVAQADPVTPNVGWFALAKSHPNYAELNAILLTAKTTQHLVDVTTSGQLACGHADVSAISLP